MDQLCPDVGLLTACYSCDDQCPPPCRLCVAGHMACGPCAAYRYGCECGARFAAGPHSSYDWLMAAMKHRCKYRETDDRRRRRPDRRAAGDADRDCPDRWYTFAQLRDHYRDKCPRNTFACPVDRCEHACRIDTAAEHYESAHGPFDAGRAADGPRPGAVVVVLP